MRYKAEYKPTQMLCPKYFRWVDADEAIAKLQMTPRHVCPLVEPATKVGKQERDNNNTDLESNEGGTNGDKKADITAALNVLQMDIGAGINVTIDMLQSSGVNVVKPILEEFILEVSPDLSKKCLVKLS